MTKKFMTPIDIHDPEAWKSDDPIVIDVQMAGIDKTMPTKKIYEICAKCDPALPVVPPGLYQVVLRKIK